jgi:hypothetical protein
VTKYWTYCYGTVIFRLDCAERTGWPSLGLVFPEMRTVGPTDMFDQRRPGLRGDCRN